MLTARATVLIVPALTMPPETVLTVGADAAGFPAIAADRATVCDPAGDRRCGRGKCRSRCSHCSG